MNTENTVQPSSSADALRQFAAEHQVICLLLMDFIPESGFSAGLELTVMRRAELFRQYLGLPCYLVTHAYQPQVVNFAQNQISLGRMAGAQVASLYDYVQEIKRNVPYTPPDDFDPLALPPGWSAVTNQEGRGDFLFDKQGVRRRYRNYAPGDRAPAYVNYLDGETITRRHIYDPLGFLSREEVLTTEGQLEEAIYYRPDGTLALKEHFKAPAPRPATESGAPINDWQLDRSPQRDRITLYAADGVEVVQEFVAKDELIAWWLLGLLRERDCHYLVIVDHALQYQRYFVELKSQRSDYPNITVVASTHNCHCVDPTDPNSTLGDNYLFLSDPRMLMELVVTQTKRQAEDIAARFPEHAYATGSIPNPLTALNAAGSGFAPARSTHDIAIVGRLMPQKGVDLGLEAFAVLTKSLPSVRLHIFGSGPLERELKVQAAHLGISSKVVFHGFVVNLREVMQAVACLWCTSRFEGFTRVIQEALSVGTPVIAFDCRYGPSEMIENGLNGYLIPPYDTRALAARTVTFLKDRKLQRKMQKAAPRSVAGHSPQAVAERWAKLLLPLLKQDVAAAASIAASPAVPAAGVQDAANSPAELATPKAEPKQKTPTRKKSTTKSKSSEPKKAPSAKKKSPAKKTVEKKSAVPTSSSSGRKKKSPAATVEQSSSAATTGRG